MKNTIDKEGIDSQKKGEGKSMTYTIYEIGDGDYTASPQQLGRDYAAPVGSIEVIRTPALLVATTWGEHLQVLSDRCITAWQAGKRQIAE